MSAPFLELDGITVDLQANLESEIQAFGGFKTTPNQWAIDFAEAPPIFHGTDIKGVRGWAVSSGLALHSHRTLHGAAVTEKGPETTRGNTCAEDRLRGLDEFVFASLGMLAVGQNHKPFAAIVLDPNILPTGYVSLHDLAAFDNVILSPSERFGTHDEDELSIANQAAFERYTRTLVSGDTFREIFSRYLSRHFRSSQEFLSSHDFIPGKRDIPARDSLAYAEMLAKKQFCIDNGLPTPIEIVEGCGYKGPQLIVKDAVEGEYIKGVVLYKPSFFDDRAVKLAAQAVEQAGKPVSVVTGADLEACRPLVADKLFKRGSQNFRKTATTCAALNLAFVAAAKSFTDESN